jgi:hypothetical protein
MEDHGYPLQRKPNVGPERFLLWLSEALAALLAHVRIESVFLPYVPAFTIWILQLWHVILNLAFFRRKVQNGSESYQLCLGFA